MPELFCHPELGILVPHPYSTSNHWQILIILLLLTSMSKYVGDAIDPSSLDVLIPAESKLDIEKFLGPIGYENSKPSGQPPLSIIPQRDVLYFGRSPAHTLPDSILLLILGNEQTS